MSPRSGLLRHHRCPVLALLLLAYVVLVESFVVPLAGKTSAPTTALSRRRIGGHNSQMVRSSTVQARPPTTSTSSTTSPSTNPHASGGNPHANGGNPHAMGPPPPSPESLLPASFFTSLPWSHSITGESAEETLLYMPFVEAQMRHLEEHGGFVKEIPTPPTVAYARAEKKASHMASFCVETEDFRKIRFTYMDGGKGVQVFNSVWYPRFDTDAPILGIDLLLFGGHSMLAVVDFQPLSQDDEYRARFIDQLAPIKQQYPCLCDAMSNRYYEDTRWFSPNMLFGRLQERGQVMEQLMPAFQEYMSIYTQTVRRTRGEGEASYVQSRHKDYDEYNLIRDPAGKLFEAYFGKEWAHEMLTFQFDLADPKLLEVVPPAGVPVPPPHAVPGKGAAA